MTFNNKIAAGAAKELAEIILSVVKNKKYPGREGRIVRTGHFSPKMFNPDRLLRMKALTFARLILNIAMEIPKEELIEMFNKALSLIIRLSNDQDGTTDAINKAHEGLRLNNKKSNNKQKVGL